MTPTELNELIQNTEDLIIHILEAIVQNPDDIKISTSVRDNNQALMIKARVKDSDAGLAVGRKGCVILAIRSILDCVAGRYKVEIRYDLENQEKRPQRVS